MRIKELKKELVKVKEKHELFMANLKESDNPQTKEYYVYNCHIVETLEAVLARIEGDRIALDLL